MADEAEGRAGVARVEAYSDAVIAIVVTIMVLEMHAPEQPGWGPLLGLWPVLTAYVLSFVYVSISGSTTTGCSTTRPESPTRSCGPTSR
jgi:uncharacterized membrane protein